MSKDPNHIDILNMELEGSLPHWLSPEGKMTGKRADIRAKHRAAHLARPIARKPVRPETKAKADATYEAAKKTDPAFNPDTLAESAAFERHRKRTHLLPLADIHGAAEEGAFGRHRQAQRQPYLVGAVLALAQELDIPADIPEKLQLVAWSKAIMVLDGSEIMVRDLIERELAGTRLMPIARILATTERLVRRIAAIRITAIKTAFRLLRERLGDKPILDHSIAVWAKTFAEKDTASIRTAIVSGLSDGLDNTEIARKVVGSMGMNGVDGVTEFTRRNIAHLGRAAIKESRARKGT